MKYFKFVFAPFYFCVVFLFMCSFCACSKKNFTGRCDSVTFACWNVQTFFDAETDGTEYNDYKNMAKWSKEKYSERLRRLCEVMTTLNPDVFVLEEIENSAVVQDIANSLAGNSWHSKKVWQYACFSKTKGTAIGCAVFSRFALRDMKLHSMLIKSEKKAQPASRPIIQVTVDVNGHNLVLFVNHWKSKSGGAEETEVWRNWQEMILAGRIENIYKADSKSAIIACGDFNRNAADFVCKKSRNGLSNVVLRGSNTLGADGENICVYNPWLDENGKYKYETGSYFYKNSWEYIDNIFCIGNVEILDFRSIAESPWANEDSVPNCYKIYNGKGYSDHLPLFSKLSFLE